MRGSGQTSKGPAGTRFFYREKAEEVSAMVFLF
jgi:hypothetical protein